MRVSSFLIPFLSLAASLLPSALAKMRYTGDVVNGYPVISHLDAEDLAPSNVHRFYFRAGSLNSGHPIHVPVWIARGADPVAERKKFWISTVRRPPLVAVVVAWSSIDVPFFFAITSQGGETM
ncbi:hypothetical protein ACQY0O_000341 [Thecaphora frezii]